MTRLVVLISGRGSNFCAIDEAIDRGELPARIVLVISTRATNGGVTEARRRGIDVQVIEPGAYPDRDQFDNALARQIQAAQPDWIVLAGFMRILGDNFIRKFTGRLVNIHPSLLPAYPGLHTHRQALADGADEHGATVHMVSTDLDDGLVLGRVRVAVLKSDTETTLAARVLGQEHRLYPWVLNQLIAHRLQWDENLRQLQVDGEPGAALELSTSSEACS